VLCSVPQLCIGHMSTCNSRTRASWFRFKFWFFMSFLDVASLFVSWLVIVFSLASSELGCQCY